ncbi:phosphoglycerate mutase [Secundilactobacillus silagincola]|uniref:Phosphoglycerate mutase n=1 Tax=Secundilactobacillus silagincola TaxID=1714681 RepID=A0A1Z5J0N1_9LACO|nr:histidine phosphatase family protein [Secundilactobacillus silagincola]GAX07597.1 phosphoglycerate mutase [Secundilactobacillus silagincola]
MTLFVTRHGETTLNQHRKFYGSMDVALDDKGQQQAAELAKKLRRQKLDVIIRSATTRTKQTAQPIIDDHPNATVYVNADLNEKGFGDWEGLDADEIEAQDPVTWARWIEKPFDVTPKGAESYKVFSERVLHAVAGYQDLLASAANVLVVAHLGTLRVMHQSWVPDTVFWDLNFKAGHYSTYQSDGQGKMKVIAFNQ